MNLVIKTRLVVAILLSGITLSVPRASAQEITVVNGANLVIPPGTVDPSAMLGTDFGHVEVSSGSLTRIFRIINQVDPNLVLNGPVTITGDHAADFSIVVAPENPVDSYANLHIAFDPSEPGLRTATVTISSNDADEGVYAFNICGTGGGELPPSPDLKVRLKYDPKLKFRFNPDRLRVRGKMEISNHGPVRVDFGLIQVYHSRDEFLDPSEDVLIRVIPIKKLKAYVPYKVRVKKRGYNVLLNHSSGHIFARIESGTPMTEDLHWFDNTSQSGFFQLNL